MNYLAHIYLSDNDDFIKIGNFMADAIKGKHYENYPIGIQIGIRLHRFIDSYTDSHLVYRQSKHRLHKKFGHYSGVIMDIVYDHFLAKNWEKYSIVKLEKYADDFYKLLQDNYDILTDKTKDALPYMKETNWLIQYKTLAGLELILFQMDHRTKKRANMPASMIEIKEFYTQIEKEFFIFFEDLEKHYKIELSKLKNEFNYNLCD